LLKKTDPWLAGSVLLAAAFLLINIGDRNGRLWQDEAETAFLAKNILQYGYPRATDGLNRLNPSIPLAAGEAWTYHPWLSFYVTAASFKLLGTGTAAARLPFAAMGVLCVWLFYRVIRRITGDRSPARWSAFLLATSVPFLLHMRQCRYYAPSVLFSLWAVLAYWRVRQGKRWSFPEMVLVLVLLFHTNHGVFIPLLLGLGLHLVLKPPDAAALRRLAGAGVAALALTAPFLYHLQSAQHHTGSSWKEISHHAQFYFRQINTYLLPLTVWILPLLIWRSAFRPAWGSRGSSLRESWRLAACFLVAGLLFLIFVPYQRHFRYLITLIPWLLMIQAALLKAVVRLHRPLGLVLAGLLTLTNFHYAAPYALSGSEKGRIRSFQLELLDEITHTYRGPMDGVVELLNREGKPGQSVKIPYGEYTLFLYTPLRVESFARMEEFAQETIPDWIILRRDWLPGGFLESDYFRRIRSSYREILLDVPDIPWQNRPDPGYHRFRTDSSAPGVRLFQKR
jgi:4-amino-4-deoxy-L-arabinose transferase-like glycosyltransferase